MRKYWLLFFLGTFFNMPIRSIYTESTDILKMVDLDKTKLKQLVPGELHPYIVSSRLLK